MAAIERSIADYQPTTDPFNGATRLLLGSVAHDQIVPLMHAIDRRRVAVEICPRMSPATGIGFRAIRDNDPEWMIVQEYGTLVWVMGQCNGAITS